MYSANQYLFASSVQEAVQELQKSPSNRIIAGGTWLRMCPIRIGTLIDLSRLELNKIESVNGEIHIGAMTLLRDIETSQLLREACGGVLPASVKDIVGVQFRNSATVGAGVYSGFGFSDPLCSLLAMDADVVLAIAGRMKLAEYLSIVRTRKNRDILLEILVKPDGCTGSWQTFRQTATDYSVLNLCAVKTADNKFRIAIGSRPAKAVRCVEAEQYLEQGDVAQAMEAVTKLRYGSNLRGSASYRQVLAKVLLEDAMKELEVNAR